MNTEILGVIAQIVLMVALSYPLGKYIAKVYKGKKVWSDFMKPVENLILPAFRNQSGRRNELETIFESFACS